MRVVLSNSGPKSRSRLRAEREEYLLSLDEIDKAAYRAVQIFLAALGKLVEEKGGVPPIQIDQIHTLFPEFGYRIGLPKESLEVIDARCRAVSIYYRDDLPENQEGFWFIPPRSFYDTWPERLDGHSQHDIIMEAARDAAKKWLPDWDWDNKKSKKRTKRVPTDR
jgi:hypothetical protein